MSAASMAFPTSSKLPAKNLGRRLADRAGDLVFLRRNGTQTLYLIAKPTGSGDNNFSLSTISLARELGDSCRAHVSAQVCNIDYC